jgi:hypothetical protein
MVRKYCSGDKGFRNLSVGEALAPAPQERENSGGGKFPSQISHRKDQPATILGGQGREVYPPLVDSKRKNSLCPLNFLRKGLLRSHLWYFSPRNIVKAL